MEGEVGVVLPGYVPVIATESDVAKLRDKLTELKKASWATTDLAKKRELFRKISKVRGALSAAQRSVRYGSTVNKLLIEEALKVTP
jgi:hypothetical protein